MYFRDLYISLDISLNFTCYKVRVLCKKTETNLKNMNNNNMAYSKVVVKSSDRNICGGKTSWTVEIEKGHYPEAISSDIVL